MGDQGLHSVLESLRTKLARTYEYNALRALEAEARRASLDWPEAPELHGVIGAIIRQRLEWDVASEYFKISSERFPEDMELRYEAGLVGIDAGNYRRAHGVMTSLSTRLDRLSGRELRGFWRAAPMVGLYRQSLEAFDRSVAAHIEPSLPQIADRLRLAEQNAGSTVVQSIGMLSIGENCMPWSLGQRWGLRPASSYFDQESPFNLAQTVTDTVATLLEDGLYPLIALHNLSLGTSESGVSRPLNNHYRFDFNHEWGTRFTDHDYAALLDRYAGRIGNLRRYLKNQPAVFVHYTERDGDLGRLATAVRRAARHTNYRLVIFDVWDGKRTVPPLGAETEYHQIPLPRSDYTWYRPDDLDSLEGIAFERSMHDVVLAAMTTLHRSIGA